MVISNYLYIYHRGNMISIVVDLSTYTNERCCTYEIYICMNIYSFIFFSFKGLLDNHNIFIGQNKNHRLEQNSQAWSSLFIPLWNGQFFVLFSQIWFSHPCTVHNLYWNRKKLTKLGLDTTNFHSKINVFLYLYRLTISPKI